MTMFLKVPKMKRVVREWPSLLLSYSNFAPWELSIILVLAKSVKKL